MQATILGWAAASAGMVTVLAALAERRRARRRATHGVGWAPWPGVVVTATFVALTLLALALR